MISLESNFELTNRHGGVVYATVTWPSASRTTKNGESSNARNNESSNAKVEFPLVVLMHGFKGFRNWGFFPLAAQHFASAEILVVRLDFSQNGMRGTADRVVSPSDFAANTISRELEDVEDVLQSIRDSVEAPFLELRDAWNGMLFFVGHSRGGGIALLTGVMHNAEKVVGWNSVGTWERWTPRQRNVWLESGKVAVENTRTGQKLEMHSTYLLDIEAHQQRQLLSAAAEQLADRLLLVHAAQDLTVPLTEVQRELSGAPLQIVHNTTHTFGMMHPLDHVTPAFAEVLAITTKFLKLDGGSPI